MRRRSRLAAVPKSRRCGCEEASCGCEPSCGCDSGCGCNDGCCLFGDCCLGDAWTLKSCYDPCASAITRSAAGSRSATTTTTTGSVVLRPAAWTFNDVPDHLNLDQAWVYAEKVAEADACSAGWGYRFDMLYGVDAQKTQAFGNDDGIWDNSFDNGVYGWAIPQAYGEVAYGDWSVKVGHFFTIIGYEVVPATGNFFYSHSLHVLQQRAVYPHRRVGHLQGQRRHDGLRRLDARLGHRLRSVRRRQQLARRHQPHGRRRRDR